MSTIRDYAIRLGFAVRPCGAGGPRLPFQLTRDGKHEIYCTSVEDGMTEADHLVRHGIMNGNIKPPVVR